MNPLAHRLQEVLLTGRWIANTNFQDQILNISWKEATEKIGSLNTIAMLVFHINYYLSGILDAFETGKLEIRDKFSFDMQPIKNEQDWNTLVSAFLSNSKRFVDFVNQFPEENLDAPFVDPKYGSCRLNIEAMIEHAYYHLGQVVVIRKMVNERKSN